MRRIMKFMKKNYKILVLAAIASIALWSFIPNIKKEDPEKDKLIMELLAHILKIGHFSPVDINDSFSEKVFDKYIDAIDPTKRFFTQKDIADFEEHKQKIDDYITNKDLIFFELTQDRLKLRMKESQEVYADILKKPFDFTENETFNADYDNIGFTKNKSELKERWRKQLKLSVLSTVSEKLKIQEKDSLAEKKSISVLEEDAREKTKESLDEYFEFISSELDRNDWFSMYVNAIVEQFDPHTFYFSPENKDKFDMSMSGSFEGIGARLQKKSEGVEISELISGGPAWRGRELEAGDLILKVAQGKEEAIDITSMRLDDVVKKIKGPKGTEVRLTVKKVDGTIQIISIIRDEVETEETFAKSSIVEKDGKKFGIIYLPKFYISFDDKNNRDAYKDVALEIERLKEQNIDGIVMDLRDNGGGSLEAVVKMTGLFIEQGPIVQVKSKNQKADVLEDRDNRVQWTGPLVVMVNNFSASASEIFAAAIQDYKRGIVIGSKHTYGKGTVQNVISLDQFLRNSNYGDLGALKTTTQKFYRINGGSTQLKGVMSDVIMPDRYTYLDMGERDEKASLPWDKIAPANYKTIFTDFNTVIKKSNDRIANSEDFKLIDENAKWIFDRKDDKLYQLSLVGFNNEIEKSEKELKRFKKLDKYNNGYTFTSLPYEKALFEKDTILKEKRVRWHEDLQKDIYMTEAIEISNDLYEFAKNKGAANSNDLNSTIKKRTKG